MGRDSSGAYCDYCLFCYSPCDPIIEICLRFGHTTSSFRCSDSSVVDPKITTNEYANTDTVTFGSPLDGNTNPVEYSTGNSFNVS